MGSAFAHKSIEEVDGEINCKDESAKELFACWASTLQPN